MGCHLNRSFKPVFKDQEFFLVQVIGSTGNEDEEDEVEHDGIRIGESVLPGLIAGKELLPDVQAIG